MRPGFYDFTSYAPEGMMFTKYTKNGGKKRSVFTTEGKSKITKTLDTNDGHNKPDQNIGFTWTGLVEEMCFLDANYNGLYDEGEKPLAGVKVLVTRPRELVSGLAAMLRRDGAEVLELPAIRTAPVKDMTAVDAAIETLAGGGYDWLVFTSPSGVEIFFDRLIALRDLRALGGTRLAAIGQGTQKALLKYGLRADFMPSVYDGEALGRELRSACTPGSRILIPRAAIGNRELIGELEKGNNLAVTDIATYDTEYAASEVIDERGEIERGEIDFAVFTSASTVRGFAAAVSDVDFTRVNAVCIGKQTAAEAQRRGMRTWTAQKATLEALVEAVEEAAGEMRNEK